MANNPEPNSHTDYRTARKAFIAACEKAHADPISRVHPKISGPDGKPLFIDSVALGPRTAKKAVLVIADGAEALAVLTALLQTGAAPPKDARLVLVHAFDPFSFAGAPDRDPDWSLAMLRAVATEDLAQVTKLAVLVLGMPVEGLAEAFPARLSGPRLVFKQIAEKTGAKTLQKTVTSALAGL
jgi:Protein of unknown function (DUF2817)